MQSIQNYKILEKIATTRGSEIFRARKEGEQNTVIIKVLKVEYPTPSQIARFRQEYKLIRDLNLDSIIKTFDIVDHKGSFALVLEDFNGISIKSFIGREKKFSIKSFMEIAIKIAGALGNLHKVEIVHKDIKPHNILINQKTGVVKITDFGISTDFTRENNEVYNTEVIVGTLPYMSPEQTGRMNRSIDYRTDIYSLGVTFYEMLTGKVPFSSGDPMVIIHSHIATKPEPPLKHNPEIPEVLSDIVMKLLEKNTEDRYQNCFGLMADLKKCFEQFTENKKIEYFELARHDISNKFIIPQKLFGREKEIGELLSAFEGLCTPSTLSTTRQSKREPVLGDVRKSVEITMVSGGAGIGKSALINEIHKPIVALRGYFISGKYEQFRKDKPYSAIIQAFQGLVKKILAESDEKISIWKENLLQALGANGRVITEIIPDIVLIIGTQPDLVELGPEETRNRFKFVFEKFVSVFPSKDHPVALFLDDLQWADIPSIQLLKSMTTSSGVNYLYVIGSYRDNEVDETHPLTGTVKEIVNAGMEVNRIDLGPILEKDIKNLIVNFTRCTDEKGAKLAELVNKKTGGNPFFVIQLLETLHNEKLIEHDVDFGWKWDIESIKGLQVTDNVVELLSGKIDKLSDNVREVLTISAAIGNRFDLETLSFIIGKSIDEVLDNLTKATSEGFVNFSSEKELYIFHHDRIQEAAYSLVPDEQKAALHYRIGRKAQEMLSCEDELETKLFYIVDHLNLGSDMFKDIKEREELAILNLKAGVKSKVSSAFSPAIQYLETGMEYLTDDCWEKQYELTFSLYTEIVEATCMDGDYDKMNEFSKVALRNIRTTVEKVRIISARMEACMYQEDFEGSIDTAFSFLKLFGVRFPRNPTRIHVIIGLLGLKIFLLGKKPEDLYNLSEATDPKALAIARIIKGLGYSAFFTNPNLFALADFIAIRLAFKFGPTPDHSSMVAAFGGILANGLFDYDGGFKYGKIGFKIIDKLRAVSNLTRTYFVYYTLIHHWKYPMKDTVVNLMEGYRNGLETGDIAFAAFNLHIHDLCSIYIGRELSELDRDFAEHNKIISVLKQSFVLTHHSVSWQFVLNLLGKCDDPLMLSGKAIKGEKSLSFWISNKNHGALAAFYYARSLCRAFYNEYSLSLKDLDIYQKYKESVEGSQLTRGSVFFDSVLRLMLYPNVSLLRKLKFRIQVRINQIKMKKWADNAPSNCLHMFHLVEALRTWRIQNDIDCAKKEFEKTIGICKRPDDVMIEAITFELMAIFYEVLCDEEKEKECIVAAYNTFSSWGALGKLNQLREKYPLLLKGQIRAVTKSRRY